jgi:hypothetical protein
VLRHCYLVPLLSLLVGCGMKPAPPRQEVVEGPPSSCEVHGLKMKQQMMVMDEASNYTHRFLLRDRKRFPHDGRVYNVCQSYAHPAWVCTKCERLSAKARKAGLLSESTK